jgi:hypothetical protein
MKQFLICLAILIAGLPVHSKETVPRDVQRFVDKREGCDHMRGEIPDPADKKRMKEVNRELRRLCTGTDKELARLKRKHATNAAIMHILDEFESGIEAAETPMSKNTHTLDK